MGEQDEEINLFERLLEHLVNTARYNIWYGQERDKYDIRGRTAHESLFNPNNGQYRCPSSQQGYSAMSTWTRGLAWAMLGFSEQLEWLATRTEDFETIQSRAGELKTTVSPVIEQGFKSIEQICREAAMATCDFYIDQMPTCGIPYWDTGAPGLTNMPGYQDRPADPFNAYEPVDSSAAAIAAQGLIRLGYYLKSNVPSGNKQAPACIAQRYCQAGLTILDHLLDEPYLTNDPAHEGLILHSVYHRPNQWDHIPKGQSVPCGESSMWGDYHAREAALLVGRLAQGESYYTFYDAKKTA